jgi:hypothetical protein
LALIERKLKHNLETHVETVQKARCKRKKKEKIEDPSPKTTRVIEEWATNAAEVGDDDKDMAALWRALLDEILEEGDDGADLLRIVRSLPPSDVRFFLKNFAEPTASIHQVLRTSFRLDRSYEDVVITRLTNGGLVQRRFSLRLLITFLLLTVAPLFMMYVVVANSPKWDTPPIPWVLILGLAAIATTGVTAFLYSHHVPTKLGAKLCELYKEYRAEPD